MNASVVILLLLSLSTCQGKEQDTFPPSGILPTTKWKKTVEIPLEVSCPDPTDIEPCECTIDHGALVMDCSNVQDEEQLRNVFSAFFPTTEFYEFYMRKNYNVKVLEDGVFGSVSFQSLEIYVSVLETVEIDALTPSLSTLTQIYIDMCNLEIFPFERLTEFTSLQYLGFFSNKINTLPPLSSSSLRFFSLGYNLITHITPDVFTLLPAIEDIYLNYNNLTEIPKGTFTGLPKLQYVNLSGNNISYLQSLTFDLVSSPVVLNGLDFGTNNIEYVEVDAFKGVAENTTIKITNNELTTLPEDIWRPVLERSITVRLAGNDLACGCDVAWVVRDPQLLIMVSDARCADGTLLTELNPAGFDTCG